MPRTVSSFFFRLILGLFFVFLGLWGVLPNVDESVFTLVRNADLQWLEVLFGLVELACGAFLAVSAFVRISSRTMSNATLVILLFWLVRVAVTKIFFGIRVNDSGVFFYPAFSVWILVLLVELLIAACLWLLLKALND
jgi:hypothetical protein